MKTIELIREKVTDFNDILSIAGVTMESLVNENDTEDEVAYKQAKLIAKVYNGDRVLDASNAKQYKYFPRFVITPGSGFGLSYHGYVYWRSSTRVGVRLCFVDWEDARDAGQKFTEIYSKLLIK